MVYTQNLIVQRRFGSSSFQDGGESGLRFGLEGLDELFIRGRNSRALGQVALRASVGFHALLFLPLHFLLALLKRGFLTC